MSVDSEARVAMDGVGQVAANAWTLAGVRRLRSRLRDVTIILYATILILFFINPRAVSERLSDFPQSPATQTASFVADIVESLSSLVGVQEAYDNARAAFLRNAAQKRDGQR